MLIAHMTLENDNGTKYLAGTACQDFAKNTLLFLKKTSDGKYELRAASDPIRGAGDRSVLSLGSFIELSEHDQPFPPPIRTPKRKARNLLQE